MKYLFRGKKLRHNDTPVKLQAGWYSNDRLALQLVYKSEYGIEPYMTLTVNLVDAPCPSDEVFIKDYSENEGAAAWCIQNGIVEAPPTVAVPSGFVVIERFKLTQEILNELEEVA